MRRPLFSLTVVVVGLAGLCLAVLRGQPPHVSAQLDDHIYLPFAAQRADVRRLPTPWGVPTEKPTPEPTDTPEPTATIEIPPTMTPEPTETEAPQSGVVVTGRLLDDGAPVPETLGAAYPGPGLFLRSCRGNEGNCTVLARTGADATGRYRFVLAEGPAAGSFFQVVWWNEHGMYGDHEIAADERYLGAWFGRRIQQIDPGATVTMPDFEIADFALVAPDHGSGHSGFPLVFVWEGWVGPVQTYRWSICQCCQDLAQRAGAYQQPVGTQRSYSLESQPPGTRVDPNERYCWFIQVDSPGTRGIGYSRQARMLWFYLDSLAALGIIDPADWAPQ